MLTISLIFAAGCALINLWLALRCGQVRTKENILHGDGGSVLLGRRMRAHANFAEFTPVLLVLCLLVEVTLGSSIWLWAATVLYMVARILHGVGMDAETAGWPRMVGVLVTFLVTLGLAGTAIYAGYTLATATEPRGITQA
jgi:uncharacterized protein